MAYVATVNQPGYLPEIEPVEFETSVEAWMYLVEEEECYLNGLTLGDPGDSSALDALSDMVHSGEGCIIVGNWAYSVQLSE